VSYWGLAATVDRGSPGFLERLNKDIPAGFDTPPKNSFTNFAFMRRLKTGRRF
jgi:hypothetical protein